MNIFVLDQSPSLAAAYHCDQHVVKMVVETCQMLSTVHHTSGAAPAGVCKPFGPKHPCTLWAGVAEANYRWLHALGLALARQYTARYAKVHSLHPLLLGPLATPPAGMQQGPATPFAQCMPPQYRQPCAVAAYRGCYAATKARFARWGHGPTPPWWPAALAAVTHGNTPDAT